MSVKIVSYTTDICLPCACKGTVNVIVCTKYNQSVPAQLIESVASSSSCGSGKWTYTLQYDSDDLPEGVTALASTDLVSVVCEGCLTDWVKEMAPQVVREKEYLDSHSFQGAADGSYVELEMTVTNPSAVLALEGEVKWNWNHTVSANDGDDYSVGITSALYADGVLVAETLSDSYLAATNASGNAQFINVCGIANFIAVDLAPGESRDYKLRLTRQLTSETTGLHQVEQVKIGFFGITVMP